MKTTAKNYKNYMLFKIISILLFGASTIACNKEWLDEKPDTSAVVPATLQDCQALLDNGDVMNLNSPGLGEVGSDGHYFTASGIMGLDYTELNAYTWSKEGPYIANSDWILGSAGGSYHRIYSCNLILETVKKLKPVNLTEKEILDNVKGQALFQRSRTFYELAQIYAPPYNEATSATDLGIPLRLESDINVVSRRSTLKQTYNQIIDDLLQAKELLPVAPLYKTRASKSATNALLARIFLSIGDYDKAGDFANTALQQYNNLLDYRGLVATGNNPIPILNTEVIFHSSMANYSSIYSSMLISADFYSLYTSNDLRRAIFFGSNSDGVTYKGSYSGNFQGVRTFNGLAVDEVYLIRAECYARSGMTIKAMDDLNHLLSQRYSIPYTPFSATSSDEALRIILLERRKELLIRGLRWSDLRRLNKDERFKVILTRTVDGKIYTLEPNNYRYTLPIPDDIVEMTGIPQNFGWQ